MIEHIAEESQYVEITGFKNINAGNAKKLLETIQREKLTDVSVQFFNADLVATWEHLHFALLNALTAFKTQRNVSKSLAVEIMLYASAQRQIRKAIDLVGVKAGCGDVAVVIVGEKPDSVEASISEISRFLGKNPDEHVLELSTSKALAIRRAFTITEMELAVVTKKGDGEQALVDLVIERMALLSTKI
jgi:KEOPS complex subunit Cgi121